jgi:hypothetical protein
VPINVNAVTRVIVGGEWLNVKIGTFQVEEMELVDPSGNPVHEPLRTKAYRFVNLENQEYYGPLSAIQLFKLADM